MKKLLAILLSAIMIISLAACGSSGGGSETTAAPAETTAAPAETTAAPADNTAAAEETTAAEEETEAPTEAAVPPSGPQELVIGVQADPGSLVPLGFPNSGKRTMTQLVYERLFYADKDRGYLPGLGKSYEYLGNGKYSIELFDYITDTQGNNITASDVIFSIQKNIENGQNEYYISDMKADDDYHLTVQFDPYNLFCFDQLNEVYIFSEKAYVDSGDDLASETVGTGGFTLTSSSPETSYEFERNANYWQTDEEYLGEWHNDYKLDKITMRIITDTSAIAMALEKGEIDISPDVTAADYANFVDGRDAKAGFKYINGVDKAMVRVDFNCGPDSPCNDENLRKAIAYAIDADACAYSIHGEFGHQVFECTNPNLKDSSEEVFRDDYYNYDPAKAKEFLDKSSYNGQTLKILVMPNKNVAPIATLVQQYLGALGINVELMQYEFAQFKPLKWETTGKEWDLELQGVSSSDLYQYQCVEELGPRDGVSGDNLLYFHDDELEKLFLATTKEDTYGPEATKALLDYNYEHCFVYGLYYGERLTFMRDYCQGEYCETMGGAIQYSPMYMAK